MNFDFQEILDFWFEGLTPETPLSNKVLIVKKWFNPSLDFDHLIRQKFGVLFEESIVNYLIQQDHSARDRLARIILFDQFPRNIYRGTPKMYSFDAYAVKLCLKGLEEKDDQTLGLYERIFFYLPLMHAEDLKYQERSMHLYEELFKSSKVWAKHSSSYYASSLQYAKHHYETISRFGRFPHRNAILNRTSTQEEMDFLSRK